MLTMGVPKPSPSTHHLQQVWSYLSGYQAVGHTVQQYHNYRQHPKDGEGTVFTGVCLSTGGYPSPRFFTRSLVPGPLFGVPQSQLEGTPVLTGGRGATTVPASGTTVPAGECPRTGVAPARTWLGYLPRSGLGYPPSWNWGTYTP